MEFYESIALKLAEDDYAWSLIVFFAVAILPKNIKTTFLVLKLLDGNCQLDFFLNNLKSTATMVTPRFRFILLKILNRLCF